MHPQLIIIDAMPFVELSKLLRDYPELSVSHLEPKELIETCLGYIDDLQMSPVGIERIGEDASHDFICAYADTQGQHEIDEVCVKNLQESSDTLKSTVIAAAAHLRDILLGANAYDDRGFAPYTVMESVDVYKTEFTLERINV